MLVQGIAYQDLDDSNISPSKKIHEPQIGRLDVPTTNIQAFKEANQPCDEKLGGVGGGGFN